MTRSRLAASLGVAVMAVALAACSNSSSASTSDPAASLATSPVTRQDLLESTTSGGELGYGESHDLIASGAGTVTWLPPVGRVVQNGGVLYRLDTRPVVHLDGKTPAWRELGPGVSDGDDVLQLERALVDLGYADGLDVDGEWSDGTTAAVKRWQEALGLEETGRIPFGQVSFEPDSPRVAAQSVRLGTLVQPGTAVLSVGGSRRMATTTLGAGQEDLAPVGGKVALTFADGTSATGKVISVKPVKNEQTGEDRLEVKVSIPKAAKQSGQLDGTEVSIEFTHVIATKALTVPVTALVALSGGGYAVQVVAADGSTSYVPITPGEFADDLVEITEGDVKAGDNVVVAP